MKLAIALLIPLAVHAQMRDNRDKELTCDEGAYDRQVHRCDLRERSFAATGHITADPGQNGGVTVKGWLRNDVLVRSRIDVWARTDNDANAIMSQIRVDTAGGAISSNGPAVYGHQGWSVSYEIFVPRNTNLDVQAFNGGVHISDVEGAIHLATTNGGIHLARTAGDVIGTTTNGGVHAELTGNTWQGRQLELGTTNGRVTVSMDPGYSAHIQAETVNGGVRADFPITVTGRISRRNLDANLGSGGPLIHLSTVNGGVDLRRG